MCARLAARVTWSERPRFLAANISHLLKLGLVRVPGLGNLQNVLHQRAGELLKSQDKIGCLAADLFRRLSGTAIVRSNTYDTAKFLGITAGSRQAGWPAMLQPRNEERGTLCDPTSFASPFIFLHLSPARVSNLDSNLDADIAFAAGGKSLT